MKQKKILHILEDEKAHKKEMKKFNQDKESMRKYARGIRPRSFELGFSIVIQSESLESFSLSPKTRFTV